MKLFEVLDAITSKIYYHGTNREFGKFEIGSQKANRATNVTGIYFTPRREEAEEYGDRIIAARLHYDRMFYGQEQNHIPQQMQDKAFELLLKYTTYREAWLKEAIIPGFVEAGRFTGGLVDISGDLKREILLAGKYDAYKDGDHIVMLNTDNIEIIDTK